MLNKSWRIYKVNNTTFHIKTKEGTDTIAEVFDGNIAAQIVDQHNQSLKDPELDHCEDYIYEYDFPNCLRWYLLINRLPAVLILLANEMGVDPKLFATYKDKRVRIVMASRLGDIGISYDLTKDHGYEERVSVKSLSDFSDIQ